MTAIAVPDRAFFELMYPHPEWMTDKDEQEKHYQDLESDATKAAKRAANRKPVAPKEKKAPKRPLSEKESESNYKRMIQKNHADAEKEITDYLFRGWTPPGSWSTSCPSCEQGEQGSIGFLRMTSFCLRRWCASTVLPFPDLISFLRTKNDTLIVPFEYGPVANCNDSFWRLVAKATIYQTAKAMAEQTIKNATGWAQGPQHGITSLKYDANIYKSITNTALMLPHDAAGTITIFDGTVADHEMLSMQLCSETSTQSRVGTDDYERWKMKSPQVADNDLWDVIVANSALRSFIDIESTAAVTPQQTPPKKIKLSELQKQKQSGMNQNQRRKRYGR